MTETNVRINMHELKRVLCDVSDALRVIPSVRAMPNAHLPFLHAYMLGTVLAALGMEPTEMNLDAIVDMIETGYKEMLQMLEEGE